MGAQLYPERLSNTEHDEWISRVYGYKNTFLHTGVQVGEPRPAVTRETCRP